MKHKEWKIPYSRPQIPAELLEAGYMPLLAAVLALRGISGPDEAKAMLSGGADALHDPMLMQGMEAACRRIALAAERGEAVAVYGDYDVDGITSSCLLTDYLRSLGLECTLYIPDRNEEGYGLNRSALDSLNSRGVSLVISVDCGITAVDEVEYARSLGMDMIITDHHECKSGALPAAVAVIDCKQPGNIYPNENLAGVGVALKLVCACSGDTQQMLERYSDLVAIGTVADVMPLVGENRYLVIRGLEKLSRAPRPGIYAMLQQSSLDPGKLSASTIGYSIAPRLNAAGRLGQARIAADLLMTVEPASADALARELCELNRQRQNIETEIWKEASSLIEGKRPDCPIVLASDRWHQGVIGIAASRLAEQYSLPAIMICLSDGVGKGSCRSYGGFNLFEALSACSEHLLGFGGHALAAGLNIREDKLEDFRTAMAEYYRANKPLPQPEVCCDLLINEPSLLSVENVRALDVLEPYGNCNPKPLMCISGARVESLSAVGAGGKHLRMRISLGRQSFDCIYFSHTAKELHLRENDCIDLAFSPQINDFRRPVSVQLLISALRHHSAEELCSAVLSGSREELWAMSASFPERYDFVRVWRMLERKGFTLAEDMGALIQQTPPGMSPECFCICLKVFLEAGLIAGGEGVFGSAAVKDAPKADLEATELMRCIKAI